MAIEFNCPHCQYQYRLKDEYAGKSATCKGCRQKITIPQPITVPPDTQLTAAELEAREAAALAALADEPAKVEQQEAAKLIPVECSYCGHKWTEPITRAGKNALCPNPECRQRIKIPEPKDEGQYDWRQTKTKGPSLAKDNQQKLDNVQDAGAAQIVSGTALKEAGADGVEYEPRPLKQKVMFAVVAVGLVAAVVFGTMYAFRTRTEVKDDRTMEDAQKELAAGAADLPKEDAAAFTALMHMAAGEHAVRHPDPKKVKEGMDLFAKAAGALRTAAPTPTRQAAVAELAVAMLTMGGTEEQAREHLRLRWMPDAKLATRPNERVFTVFEELGKVLDIVSGADPEYRSQLARRLARELIKRGQTTLAVELLPRALFPQPEQPDARAMIALEVFRADRSSDVPRKVATELVARAADLQKAPSPSAQTLFLVVKPDKAPTVVPPPGGAVLDSSRYAYVGFHVLEGREPDALKLALANGRPESQVRALTLLADWAADPGPALDAAAGVVAANAGPKTPLSPWSVARLAAVAAEKGRAEQAKAFADKLSDEGLKAWAKADGFRARLAAGPKDKADESAADAPDDVRKMRAGHALARLWLARHNTRLSGDRNAEVAAANKWTAPLSAFGKAGVALGLQDKDK